MRNMFKFRKHTKTKIVTKRDGACKVTRLIWDSLTGAVFIACKLNSYSILSFVSLIFYSIWTNKQLFKIYVKYSILNAKI